MPECRGYSIAVIKTAPLQWFATIQRLDGREMKSPVTGKTVTIWECANAADSVEAAIEGAKAVIDRAGLDVANDGG